MVTASTLARKAAIFSVLMGVFTAICNAVPNAQAAIYGPSDWFISPGFSYDVINPAALNSLTRSLAPMVGLVSGRLRVERGLSTPAWSHWMEFSYHSGRSAGWQVYNRLGRYAYEHEASHLAIIPAGVTYWFGRTAYIDFGFSAALGFGLAPRDRVVEITDAATTERLFTGGVNPIGDLRLDGRFWLSKYLAFTLSGSLRYYVPMLSSASGEQVKASFFGLNTICGLTYAFGGAKGTGRKYVEVLPGDPVKPMRQTRPQAPTPQRPQQPQRPLPQKTR